MHSSQCVCVCVVGLGLGLGLGRRDRKVEVGLRERAGGLVKTEKEKMDRTWEREG